MCPCKPSLVLAYFTGIKVCFKQELPNDRVALPSLRGVIGILPAFIYFEVHSVFCLCLLLQKTFLSSEMEFFTSFATQHMQKNVHKEQSCLDSTTCPHSFRPYIIKLFISNVCL